MKFVSALLWLCLGQVSSESGRDTLEMVQVLFRHGDRAPFQIYPNDLNKDYWTDGLGTLTSVGKERLYNLGQFIGTRYSDILGASYDSRRVLANSSSTFRNIMSAECLLAGIYAPPGDRWQGAVGWQPVPIFTTPQDIDYMLNADAKCPTVTKFLDESPEIQELNNNNTDLYKLVSKKSGANVSDINSLFIVFDSLLCQKSHDLPLPSWAETEWTRLDQVRNVKFFYEYQKFSRLRGGTLLGHMIDVMHTRITNTLDTHTAFFYSSHDTMMLSLLTALKMYDGVVPTFGSAIFVELHRLDNGQHGVQIAFKNTTGAEDPLILTMPDCPGLCPLEQFARLTDSTIPDDVVDECQVTPAILHNMVTPKRLYKPSPSQS